MISNCLFTIILIIIIVVIIITTTIIVIIIRSDVCMYFINKWKPIFSCLMHDECKRKTLISNS
uniref:Uncharacterized protein n=1 Tax=Octopus bimaculoides TaxID=37653 RepID=A0A0L8HHV5_OCTBM